MRPTADSAVAAPHPHGRRWLASVPLLMPGVACAGWASAGVLIGLPDAAGWAAVVLGAMSVLVLAGVVAGFFKVGAVLVLIAMLTSGASLAVLTAAQHQARALPPGVEEGAPISGLLEATTVRPERIDGVLRLHKHPERALPVRVFTTPPHGSAPGSVLELLSAIARPGDPGDRAVLVARARTLDLLASPPPLLAVADGLRTGFRDLSSELPGEGGDLLPGLAIGDTSNVSDALDTAMKGSSLSHLTAVSGANCAIVTGLMVALGAAVGWSRTVRVIAALVALLGFVVLVTPEPSVLRAAVMASVVLVSLSSGRPQRGVPVLSLSVTALLMHDPWLSRDFAFALSVAATAGLLLLSVPLGNVLGRWMPQRLAGIIAIPAAAQLACQPILILLEPSIPVYGVPANLLAAPAAPVATVLGSLSCVLLPLLPWIASPLAWIAWLPSAWIAAVAHVSSALPYARLPWPGDWPGALLLAAVTALVLAATLARSRRWHLTGAACVVLAMLGGATLGAEAIRGAMRPGDWHIALCDVGQGDAALVRDHDQVMLIDTGPSAESLGACLDRLGVETLQLLVLTHFDHDHAGAAEVVLGRTERVIASDPESAADEQLLRMFERTGATVELVRAGRSGSLGELEWRVLWPTRSGPTAGNDGSVVLEVAAGERCGRACVRSLWLGDLGQEAQVMLSASARLGRFDLVKVSHHGSADQHPPLYRAIDSRIALIGVGADNRYGHPADPVLSLLDELDATIARTDRDGMVLISPREDGVHVWRER